MFNKRKENTKVPEEIKVKKKTIIITTDSSRLATSLSCDDITNLILNNPNLNGFIIIPDCYGKTAYLNPKQIVYLIPQEQLNDE